MQQEITAPDYTGQHVYAGIDVGKKSWKVSIHTASFEHKTFSQDPKPDVLIRYLRKNFPKAEYHCVYEAGYCGFWIAEEFLAQGIECIVVNPGDVPTKNKERVYKTDTRDARKLVRSLKQGDIDALYIPSRQALEDRSLLRTRRSMIQKQTRCKQQIKALLCFYGIEMPEDRFKTHWSKNFLQWLEELSVSDAFQRTTGRQTLTAHLKELAFLRQMLADLTREIRCLSREDRYEQRVELLITVPGISLITAMTLLTELIDINRFEDFDHLAGFIGLVPGTDSSSERDVTTGLTPRRPSWLRALIVECAWVSVRSDPALALSFETLSKRMPKNRAIISIARKLLARIHHVLKFAEPYRMGVAAVVTPRLTAQPSSES